MTPSAAELALIDRWQRNFPLEPRPYATVGRSAGLDEDATIAMLARLIDQGVVTRIGAVVKPHAIGASTLAALRAPPARLDAVASTVNAERLLPLLPALALSCGLNSDISQGPRNLHISGHCRVSWSTNP